MGYGDHFPVTGEGRAVALVLMYAGVGLFGTFSGLLAAWFVGGRKSEEADLRALREEVRALRTLIEDQSRRAG